MEKIDSSVRFSLLPYENSANGATLLQVRAIENALTVETHDAIQNFIDAFVLLKTRFHERVDIESWKVAFETKNGIFQLVDLAQRQDSNSKFRFQCH